MHNVCYIHLRHPPVGAAFGLMVPQVGLPSMSHALCSMNRAEWIQRLLESGGSNLEKL